MSQPVYTSSNGTTVTDVTDQWESGGKITCVLHIVFADVDSVFVSGINEVGQRSAWDRCFVNHDGTLCSVGGRVLATPKPKPKKYRPFVDCFEFLKMTEGSPVWLRHKDELPFQQVIKVDDYEIETANWTVAFSTVWATFQMTLTPHIEDSWVPFGVEVQESESAK